MEKKGQAMSEFLITYGWAILIVLIMIGVIAGMSQVGMIKTDQSIPEKCIMRVGFACVDHIIKPDSATIRLVNGFGKDMTILNISIGENCSESFNKHLDAGESINFELVNCMNGKSRSPFKADILVYYKNRYHPTIKKTDGSIASRVQ